MKNMDYIDNIAKNITKRISKGIESRHKIRIKKNKTIVNEISGIRG